MKEQGQKLIAAGATILIIEPAMQLAHFGGPGVIAGLAAGAVAYLVADEIHQATQSAEGESSPPVPATQRKSKPGRPRNFAYRLLNGKSVREDEVEEAASPNGLPKRSPTFAQMKHLIKPGRDILGFDGQTFISGVSFSQVVNIAIIGLPRHGKTTALRFHMAQGLVHGALIRGWDIQGDVAGEFGDYLAIAETVQDILADCDWIEQELARRTDLYKRYRRHDPLAEQAWSELRELLYIVDEFFLLASVHIKSKAERERVADTLLNLIAGASKYKCRVVLSGQALPANLFGDQASSLRDIIGTKYAFASEDRQAQMVGIDAKAIKELMPQIAGEDVRGYAILAGSPLVENKIISLPDTTFGDIQELLDEQGDSDQDEEEEELPEGITEADLEQIAAAHEAGWKLHDIRELVGMDMNTFKIACEQVGMNGPATSIQRTETPSIPPVKLMPKPAPVGKPRADYTAAVRVWNEVGPMGRPRLQKELQARGFECSEDLARKLLAHIEDALKEQAAGGGMVLLVVVSKAGVTGMSMESHSRVLPPTPPDRKNITKRENPYDATTDKPDAKQSWLVGPYGYRIPAHHEQWTGQGHLRPV